MTNADLIVRVSDKVQSFNSLATRVEMHEYVYWAEEFCHLAKNAAHALEAAEIKLGKAREALEAITLSSSEYASDEAKKALAEIDK